MPNDNLWRLLGLCILAFKVVWSAPAHGDASSASEVVSKNEQDITEGLISHYQSLNRGSEPPSLLPGSGLRLGSNVRTNGKGRAELSAVPNKHELIYTMPTMVGDKTLMLIFDTGSSDTSVSVNNMMDDRWNADGLLPVMSLARKSQVTRVEGEQNSSPSYSGGYPGAHFNSFIRAATMPLDMWVYLQ